MGDKCMAAIALFLLCLLPMQIHAEAVSQIELQGQILEKGTKIPLKDVTVFILPYKVKAQTDSKGRFKFSEIPISDSISEAKPKIAEGSASASVVDTVNTNAKISEITWVVNLPGYEKLEEVEELNSKSVQFNDSQKKSFRTFYVEKSEYLSFETTVTGIKNKKDTSVKSLSRAQFLQAPGAQGDPVKAVQNLPGVNRTFGFSSQVVIQGSAPQDTKYDIDGHEVPVVFHFGGLTSVVIPEAVDQVDYFSAGYGVDNGRALGGVVSLKTRTAEVDDRETKKMFFVDTMKSGGLIETQLSDTSSVIVGGRYSYIGLVLGAVLKNNDRFNLTVAPEYSDFVTIYTKKLSDKEHMRWVGLLSRDRLEFLFKEPVREDPSVRGSFRNETNFVRLIPQWEKDLDEGNKIHLSAGIGKDYFLVDIGERYFHSDIFLLTVRGDYEQKISPEWKNIFGFDNQYYDALIDVNLPIARSEGGVSNPISSLEMRQVDLRSRITNVGGYYKAEYNPNLGPVTWYPGLRWDYFKRTKEHYVWPRLSAKFKWDSSLSYKLGTGIYVQPPTPQEADSTFGNPDVKSPRAYHMMLGFEKDFRGENTTGNVLGINYFDKWFDNLVIESKNYVLRDNQLIAEIYNNDGKGRAYGFECSLKTIFENDFSSQLAYTYSRSSRWNPRQSETVFQYDQTHNVNWILAQDIKSGSWKNWRWSTRYRHVTGNPTTPVIGASFDADNDVYLPKRGVIYSERLKDFSQLDLRLDKKCILQTEVWTAYLDVQNVLNQKNSETVRYAYDYSAKEDITGLPVLLALGMKGEF